MARNVNASDVMVLNVNVGRATEQQASFKLI